MDFNIILDRIKPDEQEKSKVKSLSDSMITFINDLAKEKGIKAQAILVGSVAKGTWLKGKADIDIFLHFPLDAPESLLKEKGLYLGYQCIKKMNGVAEERYASHPYVTGLINGYEVDFVPCYSIENGEQLKSAVDRTILHTHYINNNLKEKQINEVLFLKKFMEGVETYGSEFKVGGFAGYLCELLILEYGSFENVLKASTNWKKGLIIDLENYGTGKNFSESLVMVDPTDKNRNVAAALTQQKMAEFIAASRNFLQNPQESYFYPVIRNVSCDDLEKGFESRGTKTILITFKPPKVPADALYPQLKKTEVSLVNKMNNDGFEVMKSGYWTDESEFAFIILEFINWKLPPLKKHLGPKIWTEMHQERFLDKYGDSAWVEDDHWVVKVERKHQTPENLINYLLKSENIHHLKTGKHLKKQILKTYELMEIKDFLKSDQCSNKVLEFLDDFLSPGKHLRR